MRLPKAISTQLGVLMNSAIAGGGFPRKAGGEYRPDATAWAIMTLTKAGVAKDLVDKARTRLSGSQLGDGRICISSEHPEAYWPTSLAILAWEGSDIHREQQVRAVQFLLHTTGRHFVKDPQSPVAHDPSIHGWPWVIETHSMVAPTALSVHALRAAGYEDHSRTREAVRMLLDRQLPHGGWNYGNTAVYGQELHAQPENTGLALSAIAGIVPSGKIRRSVDYLEAQVNRLRTPLSLGWGLLGLGAWGVRPEKALSWIEESFRRQEKYIPYDTVNLSLLLLAFLSPKGGGLSSTGKGRESGL